MAVGFPPGVAPKDERVVATGMVRTMVLVPVVMAPRLCMGVGNFTLVACGDGPGEGLAGRPEVLLLISCKLKLRPWRRLLADVAPGRELLGEVATRRLWSVCKGLGAVLLEITEEAGLADTPASEALGLVVVRSPVSSLAPAAACPSVIMMGFPPPASGAPPGEGVQGPPAGSPWEMRDTLILGRLEALLPDRGLEGWCRFSWTLRSSFSASSACSDEMGTWACLWVSTASVRCTCLFSS